MRRPFYYALTFLSRMWAHVGRCGELEAVQKVWLKLWAGGCWWVGGIEACFLVLPVLGSSFDSFWQHESRRELAFGLAVFAGNPLSALGPSKSICSKVAASSHPPGFLSRSFHSTPRGPAAGWMYVTHTASSHSLLVHVILTSWDRPAARAPLACARDCDK